MCFHVFPLIQRWNPGRGELSWTLWLPLGFSGCVSHPSVAKTSYFVEELDLTKKIASKSQLNWLSARAQESHRNCGIELRWVIPRDSRKIEYYTECRWIPSDPSGVFWLHWLHCIVVKLCLWQNGAPRGTSSVGMTRPIPDQSLQKHTSISHWPPMCVLGEHSVLVLAGGGVVGQLRVAVRSGRRNRRWQHSKRIMA
jgi:hypothetical protein